MNGLVERLRIGCENRCEWTLHQLKVSDGKLYAKWGCASRCTLCRTCDSILSTYDLTHDYIDIHLRCSEMQSSITHLKETIGHLEDAIYCLEETIERLSNRDTSTHQGDVDLKV